MFEVFGELFISMMGSKFAIDAKQMVI